MMAAKKKVMKEKVDLQTLTQQVVEKSHQLGVTGYEYHHNGVEMTLTGLNKVLNGTTKKTNLNNLRQMQQYLAENYENGPSVVKENQQQYAKISSEEKSLLQRLKIIEDKVDKSLLKQDIIFEIIKNAKSVELAYIDKMFLEKLNSLQEKN